MGAKRAIIISLVIWSFVVIYAYFGMKGSSRVLEFTLLGVVIAIVLGGSQAISRSLFAEMIPMGREAEFYSFYEISDRGTSWIGPLVFGLVNQLAGNLRPAILSLSILLCGGPDCVAVRQREEGRRGCKEVRLLRQVATAASGVAEELLRVEVAPA